LRLLQRVFHAKTAKLLLQQQRNKESGFYFTRQSLWNGAHGGATVAAFFAPLRALRETEGSRFSRKDSKAFIAATKEQSTVVGFL